MRVQSILRRMTAVTAAALLLAGATGLPHEHPADHDGERAHIEIPHGGHVTVVDLATARVRSHAPAPSLALAAVGSDDAWSGPPLTESEPALQPRSEPQPRPPPQPRQARAPPLS